MYSDPVAIDQIRDLPHSHGVEAIDVSEIETGWDFRVYNIDNAWMLRLPRRSECIPAFEREQQLLKLLSPMVPFAVPETAWKGELGGVPYSVYRRIGGHEMRHGNDARVVGSAIAAIHSATRQCQTALGLDDNFTHWTEDYCRRYADIQRVIRKVADHSTVTAVDDATRVVMEPKYYRGTTPTLVHCDLAPEHILFADNQDSLSGIIDFADFRIGDPAIDFVGVMMALGVDGVERAITTYGSDVAIERVVAYRLLAAANEVAWAQSHSDATATATALAHLSLLVAGSY